MLINKARLVLKPVQKWQPGYKSDLGDTDGQDQYRCGHVRSLDVNIFPNLLFQNSYIEYIESLLNSCVRPPYDDGALGQSSSRTSLTINLRAFKTFTLHGELCESFFAKARFPWSQE